MRAIRDTVIVKERGDLDPGISDLLVIPDTAKRVSPSVEPDHMCYGEIVSIGPGSIEQPLIEWLRVGAIVTYDLANVNHAYIADGVGYQIVPQKAIVECDGAVLLDWVVTVQDTDAMQQAISKHVLMPDGILIDGQRTESVTADGNMKLVYERVVGVGPGRRYYVRDLPPGDPKRLAYDDVRAPDRYSVRMSIPDVKREDLVAFSPSAATRFRRGGKYYRAVPWDECQGVVE